MSRAEMLYWFGYYARMYEFEDYRGICHQLMAMNQFDKLTI